MPSDFLFPRIAQLEIQRGTTGELEPILDPPLQVRCLLAEGLRRVETADGREEVSTTVAYCAPETPDVPTGSRLTIGGESFAVISTAPWRFPGRPDIETVELRLGTTRR